MAFASRNLMLIDIRENNLRAQRGFTLIELSIVLVIIGLIIGGIIKGQEIVNGARIKLQVAQVNNINAAYNTFVEEYGFAPGDLAGTTLGLTNATVQGNQDGVIGTAGALTTDKADVGVSSESVAAWVELYALGLVQGIVPSTAAANAAVAVPTSNAAIVSANLAAKITGSYLYLDSYAVTWGASPTLNGVRIQGNLAGNTIAGGVTPADAGGIDAKFDDGNAATGLVIGTQTAGTVCTSGAETAGTYNATYSPATAPATTSSKTCLLLFSFQ